MKIRYITIFYTIFMLVMMIVSLYYFSDSAYTTRDMAYYNEQLQLVKNEIKQGTDIDVIMQRNSCTILYLEEEYYETHLNALLQSDAVILDYQDNGVIIGKIAWNSAQNRFDDAQNKLMIMTGSIWLIVLCGGYILLLVIYCIFVRPFKELQEFSSQIAKGNLSLPLPVHKNNFFGAFTESFDIMREELQKARDNEYQANQSKRELVAELSHDIKTPVSTIKATCEVLQVKEKSQDILDKIKVIAAKADTVEHLIGNMFHATLEELEVLKVEPTEESSLEIKRLIDELKYYGEIVYCENVPECLVFMDKLRLEQVIDNIFNNSYKYAGTPVTIRFYELDGGIRIRISDTGQGVLEEEIVLITEKYYRGSNTKGKSGSGLGLYLSKVFMEQMRGSLECYNENGFVVELYLKKV